MRTFRIYKNKHRETGSCLLKIYSLHPTQVKCTNKKKLSECVNRTDLELQQTNPTCPLDVNRSSSTEEFQNSLCKQKSALNLVLVVFNLTIYSYTNVIACRKLHHHP